MAIVVPAEGEIYLLNRALKGTNAGNNLSLKLYTAVAGGLVAGTVLANFTEASFPGYAAISLTNASWNNASGSAPASSTYAQQTFTQNAAAAVQNVLGYYVVDVTAGKVVWAEAFGSAEPMQYNGDQIQITPTLGLT